MIRITSKKIKIAVRAGLAVFYVLLAALMFMSGRTHTILFENKKAADGSFDAFKVVEVEFAGNEPTELLRGDRDKIVLRGQTHWVRIKAKDTFSGKFTIPLFEDSVLLSVPALVKGSPQAIQPFDIYSVPPIK